MKLSLPSHVPVRWALSFCAVLFAIQILEGTTALLASTAAALILLSVAAFNVAGGLGYPSGAYIFFSTIGSAILGIVAKAAFGEPLHTNLTDGQLTLEVYCAGIGAMLIAAFINRRLRRWPPLLKDKTKTMRADQVGLGCLIIGFGAAFFTPVAFQGTAVQFNRFTLLAILLTVAARAKETGGRRSFTWVAFTAWALHTIYFGILGFSKEGMFSPSAAWAIGAVASGYHLSFKKAVLIAALAIPAATFLTPVSQLGRNYRDESNSAQVAYDMLTHPVKTRELYEESQVEEFLRNADYHWFDKPQGLLDRLTFVPIDDALIYVTDHGQPGNMEALGSYFVNIIPRYLYPEKPTVRWGNIYAHEIGVLAEDDDTTAISFTPYADGYHTARWLGVTLISCPMFLLLFWVCDSVSGTAADGPWALLYISWFAHSASEGMLGTTVYGATTFTLVVIAAQLVATYIAPVLGAFAIPPKRPDFPKQAALPDVAHSL